MLQSLENCLHWTSQKGQNEINRDDNESYIIWHFQLSSEEYAMVLLNSSYLLLV